MQINIKPKQLLNIPSGIQQPTVEINDEKLESNPRFVLLAVRLLLLLLPSRISFPPRKSRHRSQ